MEIALDQAKISYQKNEVPVGAIIVKDNKIIAQAHNQNRELKDPSAHSEILVLRQACKILNNHRLDGCDLYVTLEPCAMCSAAISLAKIRNLYFGLEDKKFGAVTNGIRFFNSDSCFFRPEIYSGFCESEIKQLMTSFFQARR